MGSFNVSTGNQICLFKQRAQICHTKGILELVMTPAEIPYANSRSLKHHFKALYTHGKHIALATENLIWILNGAWLVVLFSSLSPI